MQNHETTVVEDLAELEVGDRRSVIEMEQIPEPMQPAAWRAYQTANPCPAGVCKTCWAYRQIERFWGGCLLNLCDDPVHFANHQVNQSHQKTAARAFSTRLVLSFVDTASKLCHGLWRLLTWCEQRHWRASSKSASSGSSRTIQLGS
jgi:hypothetical protein